MGMSKWDKISLFVFIDALGWEILQRHPEFLNGLVSQRRRLNTIFGYSSACDPSIISGLFPDQHLQWSSFFYSPGNCPYPWVRYLRFVPRVITDYHRVRNRLSRAIKKLHGFTGYFQIYNVPFSYLPYFDYAEKQRIFEPGGLRQGANIFDQLSRYKVPYYVDDSATPDEDKFLEVKHAISREERKFAYILLGKLDGHMHAKGPHDPGVTSLLDWYDKAIRSLFDVAERHYREVSLYVFSDHGMHQVDTTYDLQSDIARLGLRFGKDYAAVYDSTMARFWYLNDRARSRITDCLSQLDCGRIIPEEELIQLGTMFPNHMYGESIFLMNAPSLIAPSFMNRRYLPGMHGFHPSEADSYASISSTETLPDRLQGIEQIFWLMLKEAGLPPPNHRENAQLSWRSRIEV